MSSSGQNWISRSQGNKLGTRIFMWVISRTGLFPAYLVLVFASLQYTILDRKSKDAICKMRTRLGLTSPFLHYFGHFYNFGMALIDRYTFLLQEKSPFKFTSHNEELIVEQAKKGQGVILLGAHMGNWELAGNLLKKRIDVPVHILMFDAESEEVKRAVRQATEKRNVNVIYVVPDAPDAMVEVVNALRRGEIVCMHGDRITGNQRSEKIQFLGKSARFPCGPFAIAALTGAPVIPFFAIKTGMQHYSFTAFDPIRIDNRDRKERENQIRDGVKQYASVLEKMTRTHPYQWYNFFDFWAEDL